MISLQDLTVAQVSGMIAAAVFIIQFLVPIALPVILLGLLRPRSATTETAVSWSVIGRYLHNSLWPLFLRTDSAASVSACKSALFMSFFKTFMLVLIAVAAVVTPLGLYEGLVEEPAIADLAFHYVKDVSSMGFGTPPRDPNNTWSRLCGALGLVPCPSDNNRATVTRNSTMISIDYELDWYDTSVSKDTVDFFQSGTERLGEAVSSVFDIQYRSYVKDTVNDVAKGPMVDNGTARTVGSYQPLSSQILDDDIEVVEGLIVDTKNGGIGFRNHSAPVWRPYGSTWTEDLTFVVPETVCVDTNTTLDFSIPRTVSEDLLTSGTGHVLWPVITDRGGFVNLNKTYPAWTIDDLQSNPNLWYRAYRAAWLQNAYSMAYMNVTNMRNETTGQKAFSYLNSEMNKTFPLYYPDGKTAARLSVTPNTLYIEQMFGNIFSGTEGLSNTSTIGNQTTTYNFTSRDSLFPPSPVNRTDWSSIDTLCRGQGGGDLANITHIVAACGIMYGAPRRNDSSASLLFEPGSGWTLSMYTCMSTVKATIKSVTFQFNGTDDDSSALKVVEVKDKEYPNEESKPLWAVENTTMFLSEGGPLWGLVDEELAKKRVNITTLRKEHLYLPGRDSSIGFSNMPGKDFAGAALDMAYSSSVTSKIDYSGQTNLALYRKWQELSRAPDTAAKIMNLIWTDIAANMVVGTKSLHSKDSALAKRDGSNTEVKTPPVTSFTKRVRYKYAYGIPAFLVLVLSAAAFTTTAFFMIFAGAGPATMRTFLQHTSAGRLLVAAQQQASGTTTPQNTAYNGYTPQQEGYLNAPSDVWIKGPGHEKLTLGPDGWSRAGGMVPAGYEGKGGTHASYAPVPNPGGY